jgi:pilus assembly protein Flp/PilA
MAVEAAENLPCRYRNGRLPEVNRCRLKTCLSSTRQEGFHMNAIRKLIKNNKGATAIEYGLIAALIAVAAIAAMQGVGSSLNKTFTNVSTTLG